MQIFSINDFDYFLPRERIAQYPLEQRDQSNLLVYTIDRQILHRKFYEVTEFIPEGSLLIRNISKVIPARIFLQKETGGKVEVLLLEPISPTTDPQIALSTLAKVTWKVLIRGRKIKSGITLLNNFPGEKDKIVAKVLEKHQDFSIIEFDTSKSNASLAELIERFGHIPLPPYISRQDEEIDKSRYQTIYGYSPGSVASHTAGLHFSENVLKKLSSKSINFAEVILHIGLGTFKPIQQENINEHKMHQEKISVDFENLKTIYNFLRNKTENQLLIAVGTTSVRTLESIFWLAQMFNAQKNANWNQNFEIEQFVWRYHKAKLDKTQALEFLLEEMSKRNLKKLEGATSLFITPEYQINFFDAIITNFHQPKSTLLLLVYAFVGEDWKRIYNEALERNYRFLSYGDSSLLFRTNF